VAKKAAAESSVEKPKGLRIVHLEVENIKRIKFASIVPQGDVVLVSGKNGQGKTSLMDAVGWALTGTSTIPTQPIRMGQRTARVKVDLGDFIVTRTFTRVDEDKSTKGNTFISKFNVEGKNREQYRSPQELLNGFMGAFTFDPLAFTRMEPKKQLKAMRDLVTFSVDIDALEAEAQDVYNKRRDIGRDVRAAEARLQGLPDVPAELAGKLPEKAIDTKALTDKLADAARHNGTVEDAERRKAQVWRDHEDAMRGVETRRQQIEELKKQIAQLEQGIAEYNDKADETERVHAQMVIPERVDVAEVTAEIQAANVANSAIAVRERRTVASNELEELQNNYKAADEEYTRLTEERAKAIAEAKMPLPDLSVGSDEVLYKGLPFSQASNAEQIRVSVAMAIAANPKLRIMCIRDGSLLDDDSLAIVQQLAGDENYQVWMERVGTDGKVGIVMEDGVPHGLGVQPEKPAAAAKR
jgi:DNA repair exonuclease SbcCD ATPase subunit